jgi:trehalose/maltose transport system permease protein
MRVTVVRAGATRRRRVLELVALAPILLYTLFPFYWAIRSSLMPNDDQFITPVQWVPLHPTFAHYATVFGDRTFLVSFWNSALVTVGSSVLGLALGSPAAFVLARLRFRGRSTVLSLVLGMTVFPQVAIVGALFFLALRLSVLDHLYALVIVYLLTTLPLTVWLLTAYMSQIPQDIDSAAYADGASAFDTYWRIALPLSLPGMLSIALISFITVWNEFLFAVTFLISPDEQTVPVQIFEFVPPLPIGDSYQTPWGDMMAASVLVTIPLVVLALLCQRAILGGFTLRLPRG